MPGKTGSHGEQGLNFTVIEAPSPFETDDIEAISTYNGRRDFYTARRVWLGWTAGTDWLHDAIEREFGEDNVPYDVDSQRRATHVGAAGEVATVVLLLMGVGAIEFARKFGGRLGELGAEDIYDGAKQLARRRRTETGQTWGDDEPDFAAMDEGYMPEAVKRELADIMGVPADQLEVVEVHAEVREDVVLSATYRDRENGREYAAEVGRSDIRFRRLAVELPQLPEPDR